MNHRRAVFTTTLRMFHVPIQLTPVQSRPNLRCLLALCEPKPLTYRGDVFCRPPHVLTFTRCTAVTIANITVTCGTAICQNLRPLPIKPSPPFAGPQPCVLGRAALFLQRHEHLGCHHPRPAMDATDRWFHALVRMGLDLRFKFRGRSLITVSLFA